MSYGLCLSYTVCVRKLSKGISWANDSDKNLYIVVVPAISFLLHLFVTIIVQRNPNVCLFGDKIQIEA